MPCRPQRRAAPPPSPQIGAFGFDLAGMDRSVAPGESFYRFANGNWDRTTEIPADRANYGMFTALDDLSRQRTRAILDEAMRSPGSRIGDFYASFMDEAAVDAAGITPLRPMLARIQAIGDRSDFAAEAGRLFRQGVTAPFNGYIAQRRPAPDRDDPAPEQSGLGLPDRDYYLRDDATLNREADRLSGLSRPAADPAGEDECAPRAPPPCVAFERRIAEVHWTRVESRDDERTYNKWARADFARNAPGFDWDRYFEATGLAGQPNILVSQPSAFTGTAGRSSARRRLPVLKDYLLLRLVDTAAPFLSRPFVEANFAFRGTVLNGTPQNEPRWKRGVTLVTGAIPDDISRIYVDRHFPPEAKRAADELVRNLIAAMDRRLAVADLDGARDPGARRGPSSPPSPRRSAIPTAGATIRASRSAAPTSFRTSSTPTSSNIGATSTSSAGRSTAANG